MSETDYLKLKGFRHFSDEGLFNLLEANLRDWFNWGLLKIGGWTEIDVTTTLGYGGDMSQLNLVDDEQYTAGQIWEGMRKQWIYETGIDYIDRDSNTLNPQAVGIPQVNGSAYGGSYYVDYNNGRVVFDTAIPTSATVKIQHSYRNVQIYRADDVPWFTELQYRSLYADNARRNLPDLDTGSQIRRQMPCIIIEAVPRGTGGGYELGSGAILRNQDVLFHVIAENRNDRNNMLDWCASQVDKEIWLYNTNSVAADSAYPLDYRGALVNSNNYDDFVAEDGYRYRECYFKNTTVIDTAAFHPELFQGVVKTTCEVIFGEV